MFLDFNFNTNPKHKPMKQLYSKFLLMAFTALGLNAGAQCTGCTTTIAGNDGANHVVSSGQVLCVAAGGSMSGYITITSGGIVCNQGTINSTNILVAGGILKNYGTMNNQNLMVSSAGTFSNFATAIVDSIYVGQNSSNMVNQGTIVNQAIAVADNGNATNTGTLTTVLMYDSIGHVTNNGTINVTDFGHVYNSTFTNNGKLAISNDFGNGNNSSFLNNGNMTVNRDFYNGVGATYTTNCMVTVGRDWYNSATVYGPVSSCGGFSITGISLNSGTVGSSTRPVDICDAGHPASGTDGNSGTIHSSTTYCACTNGCATFGVGINELAKASNILINSVFPNPATDKLNVKLNSKEPESLLIEVRDMMGRIVFSKSLQSNIGENDLELNIAALSQGTYILSFTDSHKLQSKKMFTISK